MTGTPYPISGKIYDTDGSTALQGVLVGARNITANEYLPASAQAVTNSSGEYTIDLANLTSGATKGDVIEVLVFKPSGRYAIYETIVDTATGAETKNITTSAFTYTTPGKVAALVGGIRFDMISIPTLAHVAQMIVEGENDINRDCNHSWKELTITNEYHTPLGHERQAGKPIYLRHMAVKTFNTDEGDKLEVWTGSAWEDWITEKTEGRDNDFWVDYESGIVYLLATTFIRERRSNVRATYRYGETSVPGDIEKACARYAAIELLTGEDRSNKLPEGELQNLNYQQKIQQWKEYIDRVTSARAAIVPASDYGGD